MDLSRDNMEKIIISFVIPKKSDEKTFRDVPIDSIIFFYKNNNEETLGSLIPELDRVAPYVDLLKEVFFFSIEEVIDFYENHKSIILTHELFQRYSPFIVIENDFINKDINPDSIFYDMEKWTIRNLIMKNSHLFDQLGLKDLPKGEPIVISSDLIDLINSPSFYIASITEFKLPIRKYLELDSIPKEKIDAIAGIEYLYCSNFLDFACPISSSSIIQDERNNAKYWILSHTDREPDGITFQKIGLARIEHYSYVNPGISVVLDHKKIKIHNMEDFISGEMMLAFDYQDGYFVVPMRAFRDEQNGIPLRIPKEIVLDDDKRKYIVAYSRIRDWGLTGEPQPPPKPLHGFFY